MEKYFKYRCYYVATQQLLRAHAITFTWPRNSFTCARSSFYVRTQQLQVRMQQLLRAHAITFTWPHNSFTCARNSFTCARNNCPMKMLVIMAAITSIHAITFTWPRNSFTFFQKLLRAHVKLLRGHVNVIACAHKSYCVATL